MHDHIFFAASAHSFARVGVATPKGTVGDVEENVRQIIRLAGEAQGSGIDVLLFPELSVSSYSLDDLHLQDSHISAAEKGLAAIGERTSGISTVDGGTR